jgi:hypothetical protein
MSAFELASLAKSLIPLTAFFDGSRKRLRFLAVLSPT